MNAVNGENEGLTQREAAEKLGKSVGWINKAVREGRILTLPNGQIDAAKLTAPTEIPVSGGAARHNGQTLTQVKTEQATYAVKSAALDYHARIGTLLSRADVEAAQLDMARTVRDQLLGLPAALAPQLVGMTEPRAIEARIRAAMVALLAQLGAEPDASRAAA